MSTDWHRYATPAETRDRGRVPAENGVVSLQVGHVRSLRQLVEHTPSDANRAHTDVIGEKSDEVRMKLRRLAAWEISIKPGR
jgi:hypothetical protein